MSDSILSEVTLQPVTSDDDPFVRALFYSTRISVFAPLGLPEAQLEAMLDMQYRAREAHYRSAFPNASHSLLMREATPIGAVILDHAGEVRVVDIAIIPELRGQGLGTSALQKILAEANRPISLHVEESNPAKRLYVRLGFRELSSDGVHCAMRWEP